MSEKTLAVIMFKRNSNRLKFKNLRKIIGKSLLEHQLGLLSDLDFIDKKVVYTRDSDINNLIKSYPNIDIVHRSISSTMADNFFGIWNELAEYAKDFKKIIWINTCALLLTQETIKKAIDLFNGENIVIPVTEIEYALWDDRNFLGSKTLETQSSKKVHYLSHAFWVRNADHIFMTRDTKEYEEQYRNAKLLPISKIESLDIDTEEDLLIAEAILQYFYGGKNLL